jgi:arylformamidase
LRTRQTTTPVAALALLVALLAAGCSSPSALPLPRKIVDLSPIITPDLNMRRLGAKALDQLGSDGRTRVMPLLPEDPTLAFGVGKLEIMTHTGAHLDAPSRLLRGGEPPARIRLDTLFGPARVVDLRWHDRHSPIQITDLELKPIEAGEVVILFLGYEPPNDNEWPRFAPLSEQAVRWLVAKRVRAIATDAPSIARFEDIGERLRKQQPPEAVWAEHLPFFQAQIPVIAGLINLDAIVREPSVVFVGLPLSLAIGNGSPMRAAAFVY